MVSQVLGTTAYTMQWYRNPGLEIGGSRFDSIRFNNNEQNKIMGISITGTVSTVQYSLFYIGCYADTKNENVLINKSMRYRIPKKSTYSKKCELL